MQNDKIDNALAKQLSRSIRRNSKMVSALKAAKQHLERNRYHGDDDVLQQISDAITGNETEDD